MKFEFNQSVFRNSVVLIAAILALFVLKAASGVLLPIITSVFIYIVFYPYLNKLKAAGVRHGVIVFISMAVLIVLLALFLLVVIYTIDRLVSTITEYADMADSVYRSVMSYLHERFKISGHHKNINLLASLADYSVSYLKGNIMYFRNLVTSLLLIIIYDFFLFLDHVRITRTIGKFIRKRRAAIAVELTLRQVSHYIGVKFIISLATAAAFFIVMALNGMKDTLVLSALVFMMNFIPTIGSIVSTMVVSLLAFVQFGVSGSITNAIVITVLCIAIQFVMGNFLDPQFTGKRVRLSPLVVLVSVAIWGYLLGGMGMVLAVPITCMIKNFIKYGGMMR